MVICDFHTQNEVEFNSGEKYLGAQLVLFFGLGLLFLFHCDKVQFIRFYPFIVLPFLKRLFI